jgi:CDP-glucose 4,6-dehydratase
MHKRPWQFVFNPLFGYLLLGSYLVEDPVAYSGGYNLGAPEEDLWSVDSVVNEIIRIWGNGDYKIDDISEKPYEEKSLFMSCEKAKSILGWYPIYNLSNGLSETVSWYRKYYSSKSNKEMIQHSTSLVESAMELLGTRQ